MNSFKPTPNRQYKGYHNVPTHSIPIRRSNNQSSSSSSTSSYSPKVDNKKNQNCVDKCICNLIITTVILVFLLIVALIARYLPSSNPQLPLEKLTQHKEFESDTINDIISPQFNVDKSFTNSIKQINPIKTIQNQETSLPNNNKTGIVYYLHEDSEYNDFCALLLSLSSLKISTKSTNIAIIVFISSELSFNAISMDKLSTSMNFNLIEYDSKDSLTMFEHIINKLSAKYDLIIYLDCYSFILQDLSLLFSEIYSQKELNTIKYGAIWSFEFNNNKYNECLLESMLIINFKNELKNDEMMGQNVFCNDNMNNNDNDNKIDINNIILNQLKDKSDKYSIISLPWWYIMNGIQFKTYFGQRKNGINTDTNTMSAALANPAMVLKWLKYMNFFESKTHSEPIPFILNIRKLTNSEIDDSFWNEWLSEHKQSIDFCRNIQS